MQSLKLSPGTIIDSSIKIESLLGEGGMGLVYKGKHLLLERFVAIKFLPDCLINDDESLKRFKREGQALSMLSHQNIVAFLGYGIWQENIPYIVMEYLEGQPLSKLLNDLERLPLTRLLHIATQVAEALRYAHSLGIVHRDLKPANIMVLDQPEKDSVKLLDFGLAKILPSAVALSEDLTRTGSLIGTVSYMSPEQCAGRKIDQRSDIYSFACILYQMISGKLPFSAENPIAMLHKHISAEPEPIAEKILQAGGEYKALSVIVANCLNKDPAKRYQNMEAVLEDILKIGSGSLSEIAPASRLKLKPVTIMSLVLAVGVLAALFFYLTSDPGPALLEAWYIRQFANREGWEFGLSEALRLKKQGKLAASTDLLLSSLAMAEKYNAAPWMRARIEVTLASTLAARGLKTAALDPAIRAFYRLQALVENQSWALLKSQGVDKDLHDDLELLLTLRPKNWALIQVAEKLSRSIELVKEFDLEILLSKFRFSVAMDSRRMEHDDQLDLALTKQVELAQWYLNAGMKNEACAEMKLNLVKCRQFQAPSAFARSLYQYAITLRACRKEKEIADLVPLALESRELIETHHLTMPPVTYIDNLQNLCDFYRLAGRIAESKSYLKELERKMKGKDDLTCECWIRQANSAANLSMFEFVEPAVARAYQLAVSKPKTAEFYLGQVLAGISLLAKSGLEADEKKYLNKIEESALSLRAAGLLSRVGDRYFELSDGESALRCVDELLQPRQWQNACSSVILSAKRAGILATLNRDPEALKQIRSILKVANSSGFKNANDYEAAADAAFLGAGLLTMQANVEQAQQMILELVVPPKFCTEKMRCVLDTGRLLLFARQNQKLKVEELSADLNGRLIGFENRSCFDLWLKLAKADLCLQEGDKAACLKSMPKSGLCVVVLISSYLMPRYFKFLNAQVSAAEPAVQVSK